MISTEYKRKADDYAVVQVPKKSRNELMVASGRDKALLSTVSTNAISHNLTITT